DAIADAVSEWEAEGYPRASQAVMFRVNALSLQVERALVARGIPYRVLGGPEFFGRTEVKDVVAYLRVLANPRDAEALLRIFNVPTRGLGAKTEEAVLAHARAAGRPPLEAVLARDWPPSLPKRATEALKRFAELMERLQAFPVARVGDLVDEVLAATGYLAWWEGKAAKGRALDPQRNLDQLRGLAREFQDDLGGDLAGFLQQTALMGERERRDAFADPVTLLTVHASKGLEFDSVVLIGAEDDLFPHQMTAGDPGGLEEERRLLHVACTRARRRLVLTFCNRRTKFGTSQPSVPSRFLRDLPRDGVEWLGGGATADRPPQPGRDVRFEPDADDPLLHLRRGSAVRHAEYGRGTVVDVRSRARGLDATVCVRFEDGAERRFILGYCKLEALDAGPEDDVVF
ncbi:MAG TPA: 3'-5' exonuclease, partial [Planctomycetota bacterium]|nr:3'-5' exonuclease [Planctomycetota bacterium]